MFNRTPQYLQYSLSTLLLAVALWAVILSITPQWHRRVLKSDEPHGAPYTLEAEDIIIDRSRLFRLFTPTYCVFFFSGALGLWYAVKHRRTPVKAAYGISCSWPLWAMSVCPAVSFYGSLITVIWMAIWACKKDHRVPSLLSLAVNVLWVAHTLWYMWEWFKVVYENMGE